MFSSCIGATLAMMTDQFMLQTFGTGDPARLAAQVITGVGFLGVGTIIITGKNKIRGLTTAAGLWSAACLGLALGIGFYSGAVIAAIVIFISLALLPKLENYFYRRSRVMDIYIEVDTVENFRKIKQSYGRWILHSMKSISASPHRCLLQVSLSIYRYVCQRTSLTAKRSKH